MSEVSSDVKRIVTVQKTFAMNSEDKMLQTGRQYNIPRSGLDRTLDAERILLMIPAWKRYVYEPISCPDQPGRQHVFRDYSASKPSYFDTASELSEWACHKNQVSRSHALRHFNQNYNTVTLTTKDNTFKDINKSVDWVCRSCGGKDYWCPNYCAGGPRIREWKHQHANQISKECMQ